MHIILPFRFVVFFKGVSWLQCRNCKIGNKQMTSEGCQVGPREVDQDLGRGTEAEWVSRLSAWSFWRQRASAEKDIPDFTGTAGCSWSGKDFPWDPCQSDPRNACLWHAVQQNCQPGRNDEGRDEDEKTPCGCCLHCWSSRGSSLGSPSRGCYPHPPAQTHELAWDEDTFRQNVITKALKEAIFTFNWEGAKIPPNLQTHLVVFAEGLSCHSMPTSTSFSKACCAESRILPSASSRLTTIP